MNVRVNTGKRKVCYACKRNVKTPMLCLGLPQQKRCTEDVAGNWLCGCPVLRGKGCPKPNLLTLHYIDRMPEHVKWVVIKKVNITRQGPSRTKWQPPKEAVICNMHYLNFKGPSKADNDVIPIYLKRPRRHLQLLIHQRKEDCCRDVQPPQKQKT